MFPSFHVANDIYKPPFLRTYILQENGKYETKEVRETINPSPGELNFDPIIDVSDIVPFRLGLCKRKQEHQGNEPLYRLVLIDPDKDKILLTESVRIISEKEQKIKKLEAENKKLREKLKKE